MKITRLGQLALLVAIAVLALAAYAFTGSATLAASPAPQATSSPYNYGATEVPPAAAAPAIKTGLAVAKNDTLGAFLADASGRTLYMFTKDTKNTSNCYDACAAKWPAFLSDVTPDAAQGLQAALIGSTQRTDGKMQVTYNGMPLYYWASDVNPGDTLGQGVGNVWYVVAPDGQILRPAAIAVAQDMTLGQILTDGSGRTLYMFMKDTKDTSNCYDACAQKWPPLYAAGKTDIKEGAQASLLGTTVRTDGTIQVTYNGMPLYYWFADSKPGDTLGQGVGGVWYVLAPDGSVIKPTSLTIATSPTLGKFIADSDGRTLYMFMKDTKNTSNCYDACAQKWPPLTSANQIIGKEGVDATLIGTTTRTDGTTQVTYNGMPLYYWASDAKPGDTLGQGVGGVWYVLAPDGSVIKPTSLTIATSPTLGKYVADSDGRTLYMFMKDTKGTSNCYDACAQKWPPLTSANQIIGKEGVDATLIGTTTRTDGTTQVTYNGMPLYYWASDAKPGDTLGQGVGSVWFVVTPTGEVFTGK